ncbi:MAG: glycosyltransferase [Janthinobacterium lividum]
MNVAVIMSVYFREVPAMLSRALDSILNQQLAADVRVKIYLGVDGPVSEELERVIQTYQDRLHRVIRFTKNRGLAPVLNDLIGALEGEELIFRMDTDDVSYPHRFQRQIAFLNANPEVDILGTSIVEVLEGSEERRVVHFSRTTENARQSIARGVPVAHPTVCFRSTVFDTIGGYPVVKNNEDIALWFECLRHGFRFHNLREPLYEFTVNKDFLRRRGFEKAFSEFVVYAKGIWLVHGLTLDYFYPLARFMLRLAPRYVQQLAYGSRLRPREISNGAAG